MLISCIVLLLIVSCNGFIVNMNIDVRSKCERKTVLDLGTLFKNDTYYSESDVTISSITNVNGIGPKNRPIFFLPGLDMSGLSIYPNVVRASEDRDVYLILAGYGKIQTLSEFSHCIDRYLKSSNITEISIVGESFGGVLAAYVSCDLKKKVKSVLFINPATSYPKTSWSSEMDILDTNPYLFTKNILDHGPSMSNLYESMICIINEYPECTYDYILTFFFMVFNVVVTHPSSVLDRIRSYLSMTQVEIDNMCTEIDPDIKTTVIVGQGDNLLPSCEEADHLSQLIPNTRVVKLVDIGHMVTPDVLDVRDFI